MTKCDCIKCTEIDNQQKATALQEWHNGRHDIRYESWNYECGDGCCSDYGVNMYINDYLFTDVSQDMEAHSILDFLGIDYKLSYGEGD